MHLLAIATDANRAEVNAISAQFPKEYAHKVHHACDSMMLTGRSAGCCLLGLLSGCWVRICHGYLAFSRWVSSQCTEIQDATSWIKMSTSESSWVR